VIKFETSHSLLSPLAPLWHAALTHPPAASSWGRQARTQELLLLAGLLLVVLLLLQGLLLLLLLHVAGQPASTAAAVVVPLSGKIAAAIQCRPAAVVFHGWNDTLGQAERQWGPAAALRYCCKPAHGVLTSANKPVRI
jgi:hypothetical protein